MAQTQLALDLPAREKPDKSAFDIRPRKLEAWIGNLPRANLGETARQVYKAIKETNHLSFNHTDRAHFLELMRE
ncbi:MAG: molecular chaperone, partial [Gammaproteobacteria bacterium]|nr:molecular chaperone [Gammaproteobacteria bacterium]